MCTMHSQISHSFFSSIKLQATYTNFFLRLRAPFHINRKKCSLVLYFDRNNLFSSIFDIQV